MFSLAYVLLPVSDIPPAEAIRAALARFKRGGRGDVPDDWLAFHDETGEVRGEHGALFHFTETDGGGLQIEGGPGIGLWHADSEKLRVEMRGRGLRRWSVRFSDEMGLDDFVARFCRPRLERHAGTGAYGRWLNPLGRWDWWDLGGRFDGRIIGERRNRRGVRKIARVSSGEDPGRSVLARVEDGLGEALGQEPVSELDVANDGNIELVATLLADLRAGREHARPATLVLPPGAADDSLRWLGTWPKPGPVGGFAWLGLPPDADWAAVVEAAYARFEDHWAAGVAYHL